MSCLRIQLTVAWLNLTMPNQTVKNGLKAKKIKLPQMSFFIKKQLIIIFSCTYWPLLFCKIFKKFFELIQSYDNVPCSGPKWSICPEQKLFGTNHYYYFHLPIGPFIVKNIKKSRSRVMMHHFWSQNGPFAQTNFFFFFGKLLISFSSNY